MSEKKIAKDPFDIFSESSTRHIKVKALKNAEVEIKNSLSISEEHDIKLTTYRNQTVEGSSVVPNQADLYRAKIQTVSMLLVSPKKTLSELGKLNGAGAVIEEIYESYLTHMDKQEGN